MFEAGIPANQQTAVLSGLSEILSLVKNDISVSNYGVWRNSTWQNKNGLIPFQSVDWYVQKSFNKTRNQINGEQIFSCLLEEPWQQSDPHYDIVVLKNDLYFNDCHFAFGCAYDRVLTISTARFQDDFISNECLKTISMHELCHMFGVVSTSRRDILYQLGWHCTNNFCIMRQGMNLGAWIKYTEERCTSNRILCPSCLNDLKNYLTPLNITRIK